MEDTMQSLYIKKGDAVIIVAGKDRGKRGKILQVLPRNSQVVVEGLNLRAKNVRPRKQGEKGQVVRYNAPLDLSNVLLYCANCGKGRRSGVLTAQNGVKTRICTKCKRQI